MRASITAISLFTGAGGLDIGLERTGIDVISANEIEPNYVRTLEVNQRNKIPIPGRKRNYLQGAEIISADVREVPEGRLCPGGTGVDLIVGGPPCQPFSSAGKMGSVSDERGLLFHEFVRIVRYWKPTAFLFENVRGLITARGLDGEPGSVIRQILRDFEDIGYSCRAALLNAADYGSFQRRVRCFILGVRYGRAPEFPSPTHSRQGKEATAQLLFNNPGIEPWRTLGEFLEIHADEDRDNWVRPTPILEKELRTLPAGSGLKSSGVVEQSRPGGHWGYRQGTFIADLSLPARTVTGSTSQDWIRLKDGTLRRLTIKEIAALQGFPTRWVFAGTKADQFKQVGNAVPVVFGEIMGRTIQNYLANCPRGVKAIRLPLPNSFLDYMEYTKKEEARNGASRRQKVRVR
jgi:DNA (cytosine-5)-methyltransferase 1